MQPLYLVTAPSHCWSQSNRDPQPHCPTLSHPPSLHHLVGFILRTDADNGKSLGGGYRGHRGFPISWLTLYTHRD